MLVYFPLMLYFYGIRNELKQKRTSMAQAKKKSAKPVTKKPVVKKKTTAKSAPAKTATKKVVAKKTVKKTVAKKTPAKKKTLLGKLFATKDIGAVTKKGLFISVGVMAVAVVGFAGYSFAQNMSADAGSKAAAAQIKVGKKFALKQTADRACDALKAAETAKNTTAETYKTVKEGVKPAEGFDAIKSTPEAIKAALDAKNAAKKDYDTKNKACKKQASATKAWEDAEAALADAIDKDALKAASAVKGASSLSVVAEETALTINFKAPTTGPTPERYVIDLLQGGNYVTGYTVEKGSPMTWRATGLKAATKYQFKITSFNKVTIKGDVTYVKGKSSGTTKSTTLPTPVQIKPTTTTGGGGGGGTPNRAQ